MSYNFYISLLVTFCFIISVAVAANTPDTNTPGNNQGAYQTAYGVFFAAGLLGSLFLNVSLYPNRNNLIDSVSERLKSKSA